MLKKLTKCCLFACLALFVQCSDEPTTKDLAWLQGNWENKEGEAYLFENWVINSDGSLTGTAYTLENTDTTFSEKVKLAFSTDGIYYQVNVQGSDSTSFKLVECKKQEAVFENLEHDFPQRILYKLVNKDSLYARIEGLIDGKMQQEEFGYHRAL